VAWFGRRWLCNILANLAAPAPHTLQVENTGDVLLAVPGPTLPRALPLLRESGRFLLIALAPTLPFLEAAGIVPDLVVTSDGGFANLLHFCGPNKTSVPLVYPLMTHAGVARHWAGPVVPVSMGMGPEPLLLRRGSCPSFRNVPPLRSLRCGWRPRWERRVSFWRGRTSDSPAGGAMCPGYRFEEALHERATRLRPVLAGLDRPFREHWPQEEGFRSSGTFRLYRDNFVETAAAAGRPVLALPPAPLLKGAGSRE
jgi:hypothetical protein